MRTWVWLLALGLALPGWARDWRVDPGRSQVRFVITQMHVPVEGGFRRFAARAAFDPGRLEAARFQVEVDAASIDTGSAEGDAEARRPEWFDATRHPKAGFVSRAVRKEADGRYVVEGDLTIKGKTRRIAVPLALSQKGGDWTAEGRFPLRRSDFGIGGGEWNDVVADAAEVRFRIVLTP